MKNLLLLAILPLVIACNNNATKEKPKPNVEHDKATEEIKIENPVANTAPQPQEQLDLTVTPPKPGSRAIPKTWESLSSIQQNWIEVNEDKDGYLIYQPCDGYTRSLSFKKGDLHIQWRNEPELVFVIDKMRRTKNNTALMIDITGKNANALFWKISFAYAEIIDPENGLVLWEFNDEKWLMTPVENSDKFRHIKNNCPDYKRGELDFIYPDSERIKKNKLK